MLVGYMRASKADGSQTVEPNATRCSPPASPLPTSITTTHPDAAMTAKVSRRA